ncbi:hypothetical protein H9P43_003459 [Blastocladiella emersonii ATCC 22665]|nr:hypothetical protein H9P43_003459 [Blastocladiella emersonii ATCC 22665]
MSNAATMHPAAGAVPAHVEPAEEVRAPLRQQKYAADIAVSETNHGFYEGVTKIMGDVIGFFGSIPCCFLCPTPYRIIDEASVGLISRYGKCIKMVDPGLHQINPVTDVLRSVDIRMQVVPIPPQAVLTKDNVNLHIDSTLYYRIADPYVATFLVANVQAALVERTQTTLRGIFGTRTLQECIELRESIANDIEAVLAEPAHAMGLRMEHVLIKDIKIDPSLLESLAAAAKQKRAGESRLIAAEADVAASKLLRVAADVLNSSAAMQIRYLDTLKAMASGAERKVIFMPLGNNAAANMMKTIQVEVRPPSPGKK